MSKPSRHRSLRPGCECDPCTVKRAEWEAMKAKVAKRQELERQVKRRKPRREAAWPPLPPGKPRGKSEPSQCPSCAGPISKGARRCHACAHTNSRTHILYRFFSSDGSLLYVGITNNLLIRLNSHERDKPWWGQVSHATMQHYESRTELVAAESLAIKEESPRYNFILNGEKL